MDIPYDFKNAQLSFGLGIDSLTNDQGVGERALDPLHGMYWTWNSGYINLKLEGCSSNSLHPNQKFAFHVGGFLNHLAYQEIQLPILGNTESINMNLDLG